MSPAPNMSAASNAAALLSLHEALATQTEPVVYKEEPRKELDQTGGTDRVLSTKHNSIRSDRRSCDEPAESEDYPTDNRPEWQKIASRGGRSRPNKR